MSDFAKQFLLFDQGLSMAHLDSAFQVMHKADIDYSDLYFQHVVSENFSLEDGIVKEGSYAREMGVGVRAICGDKTGFAYANHLDASALVAAAKKASTLSICPPFLINKTIKKTAFQARYTEDNPVEALSQSEKVALLAYLDVFARKLDHRVKEVMVSLSCEHEVILIAANDGTLATDVRPLVRLNVNVVVEEKGRREQGYAAGGGRLPLGVFLTSERAEYTAREAVRTALVALSAKAAPAGKMDVVLGSGWPGVLLHEAVGHGLEGDFNRKGSSAFSQRMGQKVASSLCTVVDNGTLENRRGSLNVDDEGTPTQCTTLIENGVLKNYLFDKLNARLMKTVSTGNGRRESYASVPLPRMTNTYLLPGMHTKDEIIASVEKGIYAVNFGGGEVDITSGKFVFVVSEAYLIEKGKITSPIKGMTLIGDGPSALNQVTMVGNDLKLDEGIGTCGKAGQSVPVGVGQPTLRINGMTVGGTDVG